MQNSDHKAAGRTGLLSGGVVVCSIAGLFGMLAGEPIQFSTSGKKIDTPRKNPLEQYLDKKPFNSIKPDTSLGPVMPVTPYTRNPRARFTEKEERERLDRQNNWIFEIQKKNGQNNSIENIVQTQQYDADGRLHKDRSLMEQYFEKRNARNQESSASYGENGFKLGEGSDFNKKPDSLDILIGLDSKKSDVNEGLRSLFEKDKKKNSTAGIGSALGDSGELNLKDLFKSSKTDVKKDREQEERRNEFQQMLEGRNSLTPLNDRKQLFTLPGVVNNNVDKPAAEIRPLDDYSKPQRNDSMSPFKSSDFNKPKQSSFFTEPATRWKPSQPAAPLTPSGSDMIKQREKPMVLPVPKPGSF